MANPNENRYSECWREAKRIYGDIPSKGRQYIEHPSPYSWIVLTMKTEKSPTIGIP